MINNILVLGSGSAGLLRGTDVKAKDAAGLLFVSYAVQRSAPSASARRPRPISPTTSLTIWESAVGASTPWPSPLGRWASISYGGRANPSITPSNSLWTCAIPNFPGPMVITARKISTTLIFRTALRSEKKVFARQANGAPEIPSWHAFHLHNPKLVKTLETIAQERHIEFIDAKVKGAERGPAGIAAVILEDGRRLEADFFIDASGSAVSCLGALSRSPT